ncbi:MAG: PAS domain S-box protein [Leptolyngbyaceae cyanobacterium T60_A2020_046]|nr:PAS domain S-box protein [Leptolyngbyaceae cyanobacterium T60_A2020_046]
MTPPSELDRLVQVAQRRLSRLQAQAANLTSGDAASLVEAIAELAHAIEALQGPAKALHQQNEALREIQRDLEQENQHYQTLLDVAPGGYIVTDANGLIQSVNEAAAALLNRQRADIVGQPLTAFVVPEERDLVRQQLCAIAQSASSAPLEPATPHGPSQPVFWLHNQELHLTPRDQEPYSVLVSLSGEPDRVGTHLRLCWLCRDGRDRHQLETALHASETELRQILDSALTTIVRFRIYANRTWLYDYWSAGCEVLFGYSPQDLIADPDLWPSRVNGEDWEANLVPLFEAFFAEQTTTAEYRFCKPDGSVRWISSTYSSHRIDDDCWAITAVNHDITALKETEIALRESEHRYETLANTSPVAIFRFDLEGNCTYVNPRWSVLTERPAESAFGLGWLQSIHPDDRDLSLQFWQTWLQTALFTEPLSYEARAIRPSGEWVWFFCQVLPECDADGRLQGYIGSLTDISDRKQAEVALQNRLAREQLISEVTGFIRQTLDLQEVLQRSVDRIRQVFQVDRLLIFQF